MAEGQRNLEVRPRDRRQPAVVITTEAANRDEEGGDHCALHENYDPSSRVRATHAVAHERPVGDRMCRTRRRVTSIPVTPVRCRACTGFLRCTRRGTFRVHGPFQTTAARGRPPYTFHYKHLAVETGATSERSASPAASPRRLGRHRGCHAHRRCCPDRAHR
jgi:hypothetical protein